MRSVEIECQMLAVSGGNSLTLTASGKTGVIRCSGLQRCGIMFRLLPLLLKSKNLVQFIHLQCSAQQISFTVELGDRAVMHIGHSSRPGPISRLLGFYPVEIRTLPLFAALMESVRNGG